MSCFTQWKAWMLTLTISICNAALIFAASGEPLQHSEKRAKISLDTVKMNVIKTAENGVVNHETIFLFSQKNDVVSAEYSGGKIRLGFLVGKFPAENKLEFSYCQMQIDGKLDNGTSLCELSKNENGKITLTEHFEWKSRPGEFGTNIFQEM
jgi:hypothetical protein